MATEMDPTQLAGKVMATYDAAWQATVSGIGNVAGSQQAPVIPPMSHDRHAPSGEGIGSAPVQMTFISDLPANPAVLGEAELNHAVDMIFRSQRSPANANKAATVPVSTAADIDPAQWHAGVKQGNVAPVARDVLLFGAQVLQTGGDDFLREAQKQLQAFDQVWLVEAPRMEAMERGHFEVGRRGAEAQVEVAEHRKEQVDAVRIGETALDITIPPEQVATQPASGQPLPAPPKGVSQGVFQAVLRGAGIDPPPVAGSSRSAERVHSDETKRGRILSLAQNFSKGDAAKLQVFQQAIQEASTKGIPLNDRRHAPVVAYLQRVLRANPRLASLIAVENGVLRIHARTDDLFTNFSKVDGFTAITLIMTSNRRDAALKMRDLFRAASSPGGVRLDDPALGGLASHALHLAQTHAVVLGGDLFEVRDGRMVFKPSAAERTELEQYFSYFESAQHSAAALRADQAFMGAVSAANTSITASESALTFAHLYAHVRTDADAAAAARDDVASLTPEPMPADEARTPVIPPAGAPSPAPVAAGPNPGTAAETLQPANDPGTRSAARQATAARNAYLTMAAQAQHTDEERRQVRRRRDAEREEAIRADVEGKKAEYQQALDESRQRREANAEGAESR